MCGLEVVVKNLSGLPDGGIRTEFTHGSWSRGDTLPGFAPMGVLVGAWTKV